MNIRYYITLAFVTILTLSACEKEIDINLNSVPPILVIEGIVKQDQLATVRVSQTIDFNNNSGYPNLSGAIVTISDDKENVEVLQQDETGWYTAQKLKGVIGRTYNMSVVYEGETYIATSKMPPQVPLDSVTMTKIPIMDYAIPMIHFRDPAGKINQYYRAVLFINGKQHPDIGEMVMSAEFLDGDVVNQFLPVYIHDDDNDPINQGDEVTVEFQCIDKGTYTFFDTLSYMEESKTNPISNISNGALGYFSACTAEQKTIIAEW